MEFTKLTDKNCSRYNGFEKGERKKWKITIQW